MKDHGPGAVQQPGWLCFHGWVCFHMGTHGRHGSTRAHSWSHMARASLSHPVPWLWWGLWAGQCRPPELQQPHLDTSSAQQVPHVPRTPTEDTQIPQGTASSQPAHTDLPWDPSAPVLPAVCPAAVALLIPVGRHRHAQGSLLISTCHTGFSHQAVPPTPGSGAGHPGVAVQLLDVGCGQTQQ